MGALYDKVRAGAQSSAPATYPILPQSRRGGSFYQKVKANAQKTAQVAKKKAPYPLVYKTREDYFRANPAERPAKLRRPIKSPLVMGLGDRVRTFFAREDTRAKVSELGRVLEGYDKLLGIPLFGMGEIGAMEMAQRAARGEMEKGKPEGILGPHIGTGVGLVAGMMLDPANVGPGAAKRIPNLVKAVRGIKTADEALAFGKALKLSDDLVEKYKTPFMNAGTDEDATTVLTMALKEGTAERSSAQAARTTAGVGDEPLLAEVRKYKSAEEFVNASIDNLNPTGGVFKEYTSKARITAPLGENMTTLDKTLGGSPTDAIKIYRGTNSGKKIVPGDFITTNKQLAQDYAGTVVEKEVKKGDILDDITESLGEEYIYRPNAYKEQVYTKSQLTDIWNRANKEKGSLPSKQPPIPDGLPKPPAARKLLGEPKPARITRTAQESTLLRDKIRQQQIGARAGLKEGEFLGRQTGFREGMKEAGKTISKQETELRRAEALAEKKDGIIQVLKNTAQSSQRVKDLIVDYVKNALSVKNRGKAMTLLRDAKSAKDLNKAFARINRWAEEEVKTGLRNEILKLQRQALDSPSVAVDYKARIKELMGDFELKGHRESTLERLKATQKFLEEEAKKGNDIEMPRRVLKALELLNRTPFDEITINQMKGLQAEMKLLEDLGRTKFRTTESIWENKKAKILSEVEAQGTGPLNNVQKIRPEIGERLTITQKAKNLWWEVMNKAARIDKVISPMDVIFDTLDGGRGLYAGANFRFFKGQVDAGYGRYITRKDALQGPVVELATKYKLDNANFERMGIVAAREQDGGMQKLVASGFAEEQVNAVKLTKEEQEVLDAMRAMFDSQFPEIKDTMRRVYNQPVEKVKNYFSFMTDFKAMDETEVFQRFGSQTPEQFGAPRKNVEAGFAKTRVGGEQKIKVDAMDVFLQHTDNTSYLLELGETTKLLGEVAASPKYAELVGDAGQLLVREWVDVIARKGGAAGAQEIAILDMLRKNVGAGILGLKLSTVAIQPTALVDGMGFIGVPYTMRGVNNFSTSAEWRKFVANMPEIKDRMGGEFALRELTDENWLQEIQRKGFIPLQKMDQITAGMVAAGAYERKMVELGRAIDLSKGYDPEALAFAQLAVRRTQSSGSFKDVPLAVSRGAMTGNRSLDRAILQFQNFLLTRWSRIRHDALRAGVNTKDTKKAVPVFTAIMMAALAGSGIRLGVNKVQDFVTGREDKDTAAEDLQRGFVYEMTGNVPFLGTAVSMAMYDGEMFPILDAPKGVISGLNRAITSKSESAKMRGFAEFAGSVGAIAGIPGSAQAEQLVRGFLQDEKRVSNSSARRLTTPPGLPRLPSVRNGIPAPPGLPALP